MAKEPTPTQALSRLYHIARGGIRDVQRSKAQKKLGIKGSFNRGGPIKRKARSKKK
jgi:hypothetical protein|tara:strand:- start:467 stop:634 length:168 start_codon:yes stop_codon:yes gene_type:complete